MAMAIRSMVDYGGSSGTAVEAQCHITNGLPTIQIIGYASKAVDEAKERLRASFANSNLQFPRKRVTINLSPADIPKDATSLDLAMAVSILNSNNQIDTSKLDKVGFFGELSLDGTLQPVKGLIGRILAARDIGIKTFYIPSPNLDQAKLVPGIALKPSGSLKDVYMDLGGIIPIKQMDTGNGNAVLISDTREYVDLSEISGNDLAKRALEIAAAGHHNILLYGPPGTGKTMLAKAICGILPNLTHEEVLEVTHLHSLGSASTKIAWERPFRSPHHTASTISVIGGGSRPRPGEVSLAHRGVLFLDEIAEFRQDCLESLRQPLEDGFVSISRVKDSAVYPADFILVATQNPCPCGYLGTSKPCVCTATSIARYQKKLSGPILDRIDMHLPVNEVKYSKLLRTPANPGQSIVARNRVQKTFETQKQRFGSSRFNNSMSNKEIREFAKLTDEAKAFLDQAAEKLSISARAYVRSVKVARTIADLAESADIKIEHISEALQYRQPMQNW